MTKTLSIRFAGLALAAVAFAGCLPQEDSSEEIDIDDVEASEQGKTLGGLGKVDPDTQLGVCYHGATTEVVSIDINAPRCTLSQVYDIVEWAELDGQTKLKEFLVTVLDDNAKIQCRPYVEPKTGANKWCVDVIDRYQDGTPLVKGTQFGVDTRNYFVAYTGDADGSAEQHHWNQSLQNPMWTAPPVELSETGFIMKNGQFKPAYDFTSRGERLLKFDPRTCSLCGTYDGPGSTVLNSAGWAAVYSSARWWPSLFTGCRLEREPTFGGSPLTATLSAQTCLAEQNYQATSR